MTSRALDTTPNPPSVFSALPGLRAVISGVGCVRQQLAAEVAALGKERPLIVCGARLAKSPVLSEVRRALGRHADVFDGSRPHTPLETVDRGAAAARAARADLLVAIGGSSAVDCAKGIAVLLASGQERVAQLTPLSWPRLFERPAEALDPFPVLVTSTTPLRPTVEAVGRGPASIPSCGRRSRGSSNGSRIHAQANRQRFASRP